jgi:hypothetical protein
MVSRYATGKKSEALLADPEIVKLAGELLTTERLEEAECLATMLVGTKSNRNEARRRLIEIVHPPPKRPLYYTQYEFTYLPRWTRDALRYLGDFIDLLLKEALYENTRDEYAFESPMGRTIESIRKTRPDFSPQMIEWLKLFNSFVYRPAKHDFKLPKGREEHRFTSREVVLTAFVTMELADRIAGISPRARLARLDQLEDVHHYEWSS